MIKTDNELQKEGQSVPQRRRELSIDRVLRRYPVGFPILALREQGRTEALRASRVEIYDGQIYALVPGYEKPYLAHRAIVSWETPMDITMLAIEGANVGKARQLDLGRLEFEGSRERVTRHVAAAMTLDPNLELHTAQGIVQINQAHGIPTLYVKDCKIEYK